MGSRQTRAQHVVNQTHRFGVQGAGWCGTAMPRARKNTGNARVVTRKSVFCGFRTLTRTRVRAFHDGCCHLFPPPHHPPSHVVVLFCYGAAVAASCAVRVCKCKGAELGGWCPSDPSADLCIVNLCIVNLCIVNLCIRQFILLAQVRRTPSPTMMRPQPRTSVTARRARCIGC